MHIAKRILRAVKQHRDNRVWALHHSGLSDNEKAAIELLIGEGAKIIEIIEDELRAAGF